MRDRIAGALQSGNKAIVSFKDGQDVTSAFLADSIARLYASFPEDLLESSVSIINIEPLDAADINYAIAEFKESLKDPERWEAAAIKTFGEDYYKAIPKNKLPSS